MFQQHVNVNPAPGVAGRFASANPHASVVAGPWSLTAGSSCVVGKFAWVTYAIAGGPGIANSFGPGTSFVPDGFVGNEWQAAINNLTDGTSMVIPQGKPVTLFQRGDFWAKAFNEALLTDKVFANLLTGDILAAAAGSFPTISYGSASVGLATLVAASYTMTVTTGTSGVLAVGDLISMVGLPTGTFVESLGTYNGSTGTIFLSQAASVTKATPIAFTGALPSAIGGAVATSSVSSGSPTMTVTTLTSGVAVVKGMLVSGTSIPAGTYISAIVSGNGGNGTVVTLSANATGAVAGAAISFSSWIETPWSVLSSGNVGDLIKIGIKN